MDTAMSLIRQHPDPLLRDAAAFTGYDDPSHLRKVFHQVVNKAPVWFAA